MPSPAPSFMNLSSLSPVYTISDSESDIPVPNPASRRLTPYPNPVSPVLADICTAIPAPGNEQLTCCHPLLSPLNHGVPNVGSIGE